MGMSFAFLGLIGLGVVAIILVLVYFFKSDK